MNLHNFDEVHKVLAQYVPRPYVAGGAYSLDRIRKLMDALGNPQNTYKVIHVAGTSGKTSTCYYIAALLKEAGKKVGLTVSPHVDEVNERVQINLRPLPEEKFGSELGKFLEILNATKIKPTYFELMVAFAFWQFAQYKVDYAVVEVGLGGLLDGTNVINRADKVCVLTDIGLDHTEVLGKTLTKIAAQKAGIIQPHNVVFSYRQNHEVMKEFRNACKQQQAELQEILYSEHDISEELPLFQRRNWQLARAVADYVLARDTQAPLMPGLAIRTLKTYIPARMEVVHWGNKTIIFDGAHNAQKLRALTDSMQAKYPDQKIAVLLSLSKGYKLKDSLKPLVDLADYMVITKFAAVQDVPKAPVDPWQIADCFRSLGFDNLEIAEDPAAAGKILLARPEPVLLVTGSFYLLNHIRPQVII